MESKSGKWFNEDIYLDLIESLKKNEAIKEFVVKTLVEKVGQTRTVKKVLEVMTEKFAKTTGEKTAEIMRRISVNNFKTEEKINVMIDKFKEMVTEIEIIRLAENLKYAVSLQFLERFKNCGRINAVKRMRLKDVIEDINRNPKLGDTL